MREIELTENDLALELLTGLGGSLIVNGVEIPPITSAKIALLAAVKSPLLGFEEKTLFDAKDVLDALYICYAGKDCVMPIYQATRKIKQLENTQIATALNQENYTIMLDRIEKETEVFKEFDNCVLEFSEKLGNFDYKTVGQWLVEQLEVGLNGYNMIQESNKTDEKKNHQSTSSTYIGLLKQLPWYARFAICILKKLCGKRLLLT